MGLLNCIALMLFLGVVRAGILPYSFGLDSHSRISPDSSHIPGWSPANDASFSPKILSDRVILTPLSPGGRRSALWSQQAVTRADWTLDLNFRANGPPRGGGSFQVWLVKDPRQIVSADIYSAGNFDGLALVFDVHNGKGGNVRGFLNDGSVNYRSRGSIDTLAFGHCVYPFRNLGRPSEVQIKQSQAGFEVRVDDQWCFSSSNIHIPPGYTFGVTASSKETPDSYELFKFVTRVSDSPDPIVLQEGSHQTPSPVPKQQQKPAASKPPSPESSSLDSRIADLQVQVRRHVQEMGNDINGLRSLQSDIKSELTSKVSSQEHIRLLDQRLERMERMLESIHRKSNNENGDVVPKAASYEPHFDRLQHIMRESHSGLMDSLDITLKKSPKTDFLLVMFLLTQAGIVAAYIVYKRKKKSAKKYL